MLGHHVPFSYCREPGSASYCRHIVNCWFERFDVQSYIQEHFTEDEIERVMKPSVPKMASLFSLIQSAKSGGSRDSVVEEKGDS